MRNLRNMELNGSNIVVYVKMKDSRIFEALSSVKDFTIAPNLMYAALFPYEKLDTLKEYLEQYLELCTKTQTTFQIRGGKGRTKVLFQLN
jgi:hypothetical protein